MNKLTQLLLLGLGLATCTTARVCASQESVAQESTSQSSTSTSAPITQGSKPPKPSDDSRLVFQDISGAQHSVPCDPNTKCTVLVFINTQCPIANAYHPTLRKLKAEFADAKLADAKFEWVMIHADPETTTDAARKHQLEYDITWPIALDPGNKIARRVSAKVTPEAIIIDARGRVQYRGRIDDLHQDYGRKRPAPTTHELKDALTSILNDQPITQPETKAIGCIIRYAD